MQLADGYGPMSLHEGAPTTAFTETACVHTAARTSKHARTFMRTTTNALLPSYVEKYAYICMYMFMFVFMVAKFECVQENWLSARVVQGMWHKLLHAYKKCQIAWKCLTCVIAKGVHVEASCASPSTVRART
jgi:hypothetical protein